MEARRIVEEYFQAITENRFADAATYFEPDMQLWLLGEGSWKLGGLHHRDGVRAIHALVRERFPEGLKITLHNIIADGENVVAEIESHGIRSDGRIYNNRYAQIFVVRDGKIAARREYLDTIHADDLLCGPMS
jgi:ketosteroid isomerase-like protein